MELKTILHQQVERVQTTQDLEDLLLLLTDFVNHRNDLPAESPALLTQLAKALTAVQGGQSTPHAAVLRKVKSGITK